MSPVPFYTHWLYWPVAAQFHPDYVPVERATSHFAVLTEEAVFREGFHTETFHMVGSGTALTAQQRAAWKGKNISQNVKQV